MSKGDGASRRDPKGNLVKSANEIAVSELAAILARGYIRLLAADPRCSGIAPNPPLRESPASSPNCLDVAGRAKHELGRGGRP